MSSNENEKYAALYSAVSSGQFKTGCSFIDTLDVKPGFKVLDMGCGTGELTKYIAEQVGNLGVVVGVDPDAARINVAKENMKMVSNARFHVGNSESSFLNNNQDYYDLHFSNHVYHWLNDDEKASYVKVAFECLKPGGLIAFQCLVSSEDDINNRLIRSANVNFPDKDFTRDLLHEFGFTDINITTIPKTFYYNSFDEFAVCFFATTYKKIDELADKALFEEFKMKSIQEDGKAKFELSIIQVTGRK